MTRAEMLSHAAAQFRSGNDAAALPAYEALLRLHPDLPDSWFNLAMLYRRAGRFADALAAYDRALEHNVRDPHEVLLQQAVIQSEDLADPGAARRLLERALAQEPRYVAAWLNLGNVAEELGDVSAALAAYQRARTLDGSSGLGLARLLGVAPQSGPVIDEARAFLQRSRDGEARADVGFALGAALDRVGEYDAAFAAYSDANAVLRQHVRSAGFRYDKEAMEAFVDRSITAFDGVPTTGRAEADAPLFICGMFRSGSTLVEHLLARHPGITPGGEIDALPRLSAEVFGNDPARIAAAPAGNIARLRGSYRAIVAPRRRGATRLTDKRPDNVLHLGLAQRLFPRAIIVNTVRHPVDVCLSVYFLHAGPGVPYATDLGEIAHYWRQQRRLMRHWRATGMNVHTVDYDELVRRPVEVLSSLSTACGLEDLPLLSLPPAADAVRTASVSQVRKPLYHASSGRWRNYARHVEPVLGALIDEDRE